MAKDLVRTRRNITRFIEMKSHLTGVSMKLMVIEFNFIQLHINYVGIYI
jgi:hypothetical protein